MDLVGKGAGLVSTPTAHTVPLLAGLVDDAGLFPPTALSMPEAVARHRADRRAGAEMLTHRFLCPASRIEELRTELAETDAIRLGLITDRGDDGLAGVLEVIARDPRLELALLEVPLARFRSEVDPTGVEAALTALRSAPAEVAAYVEPPSVDDVDAVVAELSGRGGARPLGAKLRCGGVRAELFPSTDRVAHFVAVCARAGVPFKATAGLHEPVRHHDPDTGFTHHGYLNLLLAAASAAAATAEDELTPSLEIEQRDELARRILALGADDASRARRLLVSYGSCSTSTPIEQAGRMLATTQEGKGRT